MRFLICAALIIWCIKSAAFIHKSKTDVAVLEDTYFSITFHGIFWIIHILNRKIKIEIYMLLLSFCLSRVVD